MLQWHSNQHIITSSSFIIGWIMKFLGKGQQLNLLFYQIFPLQLCWISCESAEHKKQTHIFRWLIFLEWKRKNGSYYVLWSITCLDERPSFFKSVSYRNTEKEKKSSSFWHPYRKYWGKIWVLLFSRLVSFNFSINFTCDVLYMLSDYQKRTKVCVQDWTVFVKDKGRWKLLAHS